MKINTIIGVILAAMISSIDGGVADNNNRVAGSTSYRSSHANYKPKNVDRPY